MKRPTDRQFEIALDVTRWLSENSDDGVLRDEIGAVRSALWDAREGGDRS